MNDVRIAGKVDWTGDNPFIYLKNDQDSDWSCLALFFRIVASDHGRGSVILVLENPYEEEAEGTRVCMTDNPELSKYLLEEFVKKFGLFRPCGALLDRIEVISESEFLTEADYPSRHTEKAKNMTRNMEISLVWEGLKSPFAVSLPKSESQTSAHQMLSVFQPASAAHILVNGDRLQGNTVDRDFFGGRAQSASLAHSESWIRK
jgi:hypothetical protein